MAQKYSRQRETIMEALCARCDHPTAEDIYAQVKQSLPHISLGTVYRNLSQLSDEGDIIRIKGCEGPDRFDGNAHNHYHFHCTACNSVLDVPMPVNAALEQEARESMDVDVQGHSLIFYGLCRDCLERRQDLN